MSIVLSFHNTCLTDDDVSLLDDGKWLNDKVIGFVFEYFEYELFADLQSSVVYVSPEVTQFIKLIEASEEVDQFLEPLSLKEKKLCFFAVNNNQSLFEAGGSHWSLLVCDVVAGVFHHFDSLNQSNEQVARKLAAQVFKHISGTATAQYSFRAHIDCKQQENSSDCGVYVICYAEVVSKHFGATNHIGNLYDIITMSNTNVAVGKKRHELRQLIFKKAKE